MRVIVQRVSSATVVIDGIIHGKIDSGALILVGFCNSDTKEEVNWMCNKLAGLRIFSDNDGKMNLSIHDIRGKILLVSNFTLYGDAQRGFRPSFSNASAPELAKPLYEYMIDKMSILGIIPETGIFGANMQVSLVNDGPVTLFIEK